MEKINYIGCFFELREFEKAIEHLQKERLHKTIRYPHVTFAYKPTHVPYELFGKKIEVKAVGYGCDEENEALLVEFCELDKDLYELAKNIPVPHITISVSEAGEPVNSAGLSFYPIEPFYLSGVFGGMDTKKVLHTKA